MRGFSSLPAWRKRTLQEEYYFVYVDAIYSHIRRVDHVSHEAVYIVIGLRKDLKRDVLGVYNMPTENETGWQEVMDDLKARGLKRVLMFVSDELPYLERVIG